MKIAYGDSRIARKWKNNEISWEDFCKRVSTTQYTTETVEEYRKMTKARRDAIKDVGGYVAGHLKDGRRKVGHVICRSMLTLDMSNTNNKVKFGLKNCHYAKATLDPDTNAVTFGTPVAIPGAVNLSLDPESDTEPFYADDMVYYTTVANNGYSGDLEIALIPESFRKDILKETEDANGVMVEDSTVELEHFALLFEFSGDKKKIRHCMYYCTAARPTIEGKTNEDSKEVQTEKLEITATPLPNGLVKVKTGANTSDAVYNGWYSGVYQTESAQVSAVLTGITIGSLQLTPAFDAGTTSYTVETVNDEDAVSATAASGTAVTILVNGVAHTSGDDATWESGTNTVTVIASKTGCISTAYTVTVTKNGQG